MQFIKKFHTKLTERFGTRNVRIGSVILGILVVFGLVNIFGDNNKEVTAPENTAKEVRVARIKDLGGSASSLSLLGTVEAIREARLLTESSGRVTSVLVKLGDTVGAGAVIGTIENSSERASVLQAQGVYEAAKANASASNVGSASADRAYEEALTQALNSYRSAFASADNVLRNTVDQVFSQPDTRIPGLKIDGKGTANSINDERVSLEAIFDAWQQDLTQSDTSEAEELIADAEKNTTRLNTLVVALTSLLSDDSQNGTNEIDVTSLRTNFATARATLNGTLQTLSGARSSLIAAKSQKEQAGIAASSGDVSIADAQVKQALGSLRLAQANLEKTIVRSPISGTVNALSIKEGTSVGMGVPAAIISSTGGFEVVAYITEIDARLVRVGDTAVIEASVEGIVTQLGSAIDERTKKIEVRIGVGSETDALTNGQAVTVALMSKDQKPESNVDAKDLMVRLPIVSLKMTPDGPIVFSVNEKNELVPHPVVLGAIIGEMVVIEEGVTGDMSIVTDARGLRAGETVVVK